MLFGCADYSRAAALASHFGPVPSGKEETVADKGFAAVAEPDVATEVATRERRHQKPKRQPRYHVILWNDDDHTYGYVIRMMQELFAHSKEKGFQIAEQVDKQGRAICLTTTKEHAELKQEQIQAFGADAEIPRCKGSMYATIEPDSSSPE